jgi:acyl-CoA thioester hydrolase
MTDETFSFTTDIPVRYRDLDPEGHVNHAVYVSFLELTRVQYLREVIGAGIDDLDAVVAHLEIDYERPITIEETVTVALRVIDLGRSSVTMGYEIRADGEVSATAETVMVRVDDDGDATAMPEAWRETIREYEGLAGGDDEG